MFCMSADLLPSCLVVQEPEQVSCWVDVCAPSGTGLELINLQVQRPESSTPCAPNVAFKHPFKPAVINIHCKNKTKTHLVVR